jgi:hypothetical protein
MQLVLRMNLQQRLTLLQELGLKSDLFENVLVRTERLLQQRRYQRGLKLLKGIAEDVHYNGVIDMLLGLCSPAWDAEIQAYYEGRELRLVEYVPWDDLDAMDQIMAQVVVELGRLYAAYEELGWKAGQAAPEYDEVTRQGLPWFVGPKLPTPPARAVRDGVRAAVTAA